MKLKFQILKVISGATIIKKLGINQKALVVSPVKHTNPETVKMGVVLIIRLDFMNLLIEQLYLKSKVKIMGRKYTSLDLIALRKAFDVCCTMREWCENVIAGADDETDVQNDKEMSEKSNIYIEWYRNNLNNI